MSWALLGASLAAVLALSGVAWLLGLGRVAALDAQQAAAEAARLELGAARDVFLSTDGAAAIVQAEHGVALVRRHGAQLVGRALSRPVRWHGEGDMLVIETGERMFGPTRLTLDADRRALLLTLL